MGGTFDLVLISDGLDLVRSLSAGTVRSKGVGTCTLLGPEGPGADGGLRIRCWWLFLEGLFLVSRLWRRGGVPPVL